MKSPTRTISLPEDTYELLREQAKAANRTLGGQIRFLLKAGEGTDARG